MLTLRDLIDEARRNNIGLDAPIFLPSPAAEGYTDTLSVYTADIGPDQLPPGAIEDMEERGSPFVRGRYLVIE